MKAKLWMGKNGLIPVQECIWFKNLLIHISGLFLRRMLSRAKKNTIFPNKYVSKQKAQKNKKCIRNREKAWILTAREGEDLIRKNFEVEIQTQFRSRSLCWRSEASATCCWWSHQIRLNFLFFFSCRISPRKLKKIQFPSVNTQKILVLPTNSWQAYYSKFLCDIK